MTKLTTAQALIKFLDNQYVEFDGEETKLFKGVSTIFGHGNVLGLGQALEENPGSLEMYQGKNEQGMAHTATAFAKQNNRRQLIACTSSVGPGSANMVTAAATASANQIPLLLLPGDTFASRQPDPALQQVEQLHDHTLTTNDAFRPVSKYWDRVNRPEQLMTAMLNAVRVLTNPSDTGAVTIALPQDVQGEVYDYPESFFRKRVHRIKRLPVDEQELKEVVEAVEKGKKPLIVCGGGVRYSEAGESLASFAEEFGIPFAETQAGKSSVANTHPLNLGGLGVTGNLAGNKLAQEADVIIGIGTRFSDFTTASKKIFDHTNATFVTINISEYHAAKFDAVKLVADAKRGIEALHKELKKNEYVTGYNGEVEARQDEWKKELDRLYHIEYKEHGYKPEVAGHLDEKLEEYRESLKSSLTQTAVLGKVNSTIDEDAIVVGAAGSLPGDMQRMWQSRKSETYHMEYGYSCMGYEIAGALGAKMAEPEKEVYAMVGDGSYLMLHSELVTSIQENCKINVMLFDNIGFGCINNLQMGNGSGSHGTEFRKRNQNSGKLDGELLSIDFAKNAEAYGVKTYRVCTLKELEEAIEDAKKQDISTLIDMKILPKTMTGDYESWWHVGVAGVSESPAVQEAYKSKEKELATARKY